MARPRKRLPGDALMAITVLPVVMSSAVWRMATPITKVISSAEYPNTCEDEMGGQGYAW